MKPVVSEVTESAPAPAGIGTREDVSEILKNCSEKAVDAVSFLLDVAKDISSSESSCDFLGGSVLAEIDAQLHEKRPSSFSPGLRGIHLKLRRFNGIHRGFASEIGDDITSRGGEVLRFRSFARVSQTMEFERLLHAALPRDCR